MALMLPIAAIACTNFIVGKDASADGSTMISYAADSYGMYGFLHFVPAADHEPGAMRIVKDWDTGRELGQIPEIPHTYTVVGNMNEHQVAIGETTWGGREELWDTVGIDYGSLIYIALERSKTAREAIECFISLINEYGYASEGETFSFGDPNEVWMMDLIGKGPGRKGANWVAVRIPDNAIAGHANQSRITNLPLGKKAIGCGIRTLLRLHVRRVTSPVQTKISRSRLRTTHLTSADYMSARHVCGPSSTISVPTWTSTLTMLPVRIFAIPTEKMKGNTCRFGSYRIAK